MSTHIYLYIKDENGTEFKGNCQIPEHKDWIEITSWSQTYSYEDTYDLRNKLSKKDVSRALRNLGYNGMTEEEAEIAHAIQQLFATDEEEEKKERSRYPELEFDKIIDKSSGELLRSCLEARFLQKCHFVIYRSLGATDVLAKQGVTDYLQITLENAYVSNFQIIFDGNGLPTETIKLNYDKVEFRFVEDNTKDASRGDVKIISWDWRGEISSKTEGPKSSSSSSAAAASSASSTAAAAAKAAAAMGIGAPSMPSLGLGFGFGFGLGGAGGASAGAGEKKSAPDSKTCPSCGAKKTLLGTNAVVSVPGGKKKCLACQHRW